MRHFALAKYEGCDDRYLDVFIPCEGFIENALNNTGTEMVVTCVQCLASTFKLQCGYMNQDAIDHLGDGDLLEYFLEHDAMAIGYSP